MSVKENYYEGDLNSLPDDSNVVQRYLLQLRQKAQKDVIDPQDRLNWSDSFLIKFLRARDFDVELSLKVGIRGGLTIVTLNYLGHVFNVFSSCLELGIKTVSEGELGRCPQEQFILSLFNQAS
jgi:hypothetical protein